MKKVICLLYFLFPSILIYSQAVVGKYAGEFLTIGVGGRALGMGGAQVSIANDVTAGYWNPASLSYLNYPQLILMHEEHFGSLVNYNYAAFATPYEKDITFGFSIIRVSIDNIPDTRNAIYDANSDGIFDIHDDKPDYSKISFFNNSDWAFYFSFSKRITETFSWGANIKIIRRDLAEFSATGVGFDFAVFYKPTERIFLGANFQDVTTTLVAWNTGRNEFITPTLKLGAAYSLNVLGGSVLPTADIDIRFENRKFASNFNIGPVSLDFHTGLEYNYKDLFFIRAGYNDIKQFTLGAGVKLPKLTIDYSFARIAQSEIERLPDTHRISLILTIETPEFQRSK
ncbi:MAG: PorV/PorQ family protein [Melioribacter sp.]|nr:PorV/PorQ family protein [Melioribacter sp.]